MKLFFFISFLSACCLVNAQQTIDLLLKNADEQYKLNNYAKAAAIYEQVRNEQPENMTVLFNLGLANYKMNDLKKASAYFTSVIHQSKDNDIRQKAYYNLGVVNFKDQQLQASVNAFENALKLDEKDAQSRENLQFVFNKIKEQSNNTKQQKATKDQPTNEPKLNKQNEEQLLDKLLAREKKIRDSLSSTSRIPPKKDADDW